MYNIENGAGPWNIASASTERKDWSYHWAIWKDIDADGLKDCMTARYFIALVCIYNSAEKKPYSVVTFCIRIVLS